MPIARLLIAALVFTALTVRAEPPPATAAAAAVASFKRDLKQALFAGLESGPVDAIVACQTQAPAIVAGLTTDAVTIGRTSHRLRNPANTAPEWVQPILRAYLDEPANVAPRSVALSHGRTGYVEPIMTQAMCLTCHGADIAADVADAIAARYPDDRATGFAPGELRGVFWVEVRGD